MKANEINPLGVFDIFAVPFNFKYERMDKYSTNFSCIFSIFYISFSIFFILFYLPFFTTRSNFDFKTYSLTYQLSNISSYMKSKIDFAYKFDCGKYNNKSIEDLLQVDIHLDYIYIFDTLGIQQRRRFETYNCTYNSDSRQFEKVNEVNGTNYKCLDLTDFVDINYKAYIEKYEIIISIKDSKMHYFSYINDYLLNNDCKLEYLL